MLKIIIIENYIWILIGSCDVVAVEPYFYRGQKFKHKKSILYYVYFAHAIIAKYLNASFFVSLPIYKQ